MCTIGLKTKGETHFEIFNICPEDGVRNFQLFTGHRETRVLQQQSDEADRELAGMLSTCVALDGLALGLEQPKPEGGLPVVCREEGAVGGVAVVGEDGGTFRVGVRERDFRFRLSLQSLDRILDRGEHDLPRERFWIFPGDSGTSAALAVDPGVMGNVLDVAFANALLSAARPSILAKGGVVDEGEWGHGG